MAFKREKTIAAAQKSVRKGNWEKAIKEYLAVLEHSPDDERTRLKVADLYVKEGKLDEALDQYRKVAGLYAKDDFNEKAVAVYKQALRIAPDDPELHKSIGEGYFRLGRSKDALKAFSKAERLYKQAGVSNMHREVLERMVELDEENVGIQIQLAERFEKDGLRADAIERFRQAARVLREEGRLDEYVQVAERMIFLSPEMYDLRKEVVRIYLGRGDNRRALKHLQVCFRNLPQDIETLELLGTTFHRLGNNDRALLVYLELAQVYKSNGQDQRSLDAYRTILSFDPQNREALAAINANAPKPKQEPVKPPPPTPPPPVQEDALDGVLFLDDDEDEGSPFEAFPDEPTASTKANDFLAFAEDAMKEFDIDLSGIEEIPMKRPTEQNPVVIQPEAITPILDEEFGEFEDALSEGSVVDEDKLEQFLTESEVFLKYGLLDQAEEVITRVLQINPNHIQGREQMRKYLEKIGDQRGAAHQLVEIARINMSAGKNEAAAESLQRAATLTGDPALVKSMAGSVGLEIDQNGGLELADISTSFIRKVNLGLDEISSSMFDIDIDMDPATTGSNEIKYEGVAEKTSPDLAVPGHKPSTEPNVKTMDIEFLDDGALELDIDSVAFDDDALQSLESSETSFSIDMNSEVADEMFNELFTTVGATSTNVLSEVDFYLEQGLVSEAEDALEKLSKSAPNHPGIEERRGQIDVFRGGGNPFGSNSLTSAFQQIGTLGSAESTSGEFQNTHLELGQTYFEMGLFQEAIEEFQQASEDDSIASEAAFHIALCQIELGHAEDAKNNLRQLMNDQTAPARLRLSAGEKLAEI